MAAKILKVNKTSDYSRYHGLTDRHPLITVIDFSEISPIRIIRKTKRATFSERNVPKIKRNDSQAQNEAYL